MIKVSLLSFYEMCIFRLSFSEKKILKKRTPIAKILEVTKKNCIDICGKISIPKPVTSLGQQGDWLLDFHYLK